MGSVFRSYLHKKTISNYKNVFKIKIVVARITKLYDI